MSILIGADFVPTKSNEALFKSGDVEELFGPELISLFNNTDYKMFNLEVPLFDVNEPIKKCGPNLKAPTESIATYVSIGVDLFTLANNHILDQGVYGLYSTIQTIENKGISYLGVGENAKEASKPYFFTVNNRKYGVYACVEHEFSIASDNRPGANPFDPLYSLEHIQKARNKCDYLIVLYHGGKEHYRYPSPQLQKVCHRMVEYGADLVICQHSHCIGCEEKYLTGRIVYGQGNFLFDHSSDECWKTGLIVYLDDNDSIDYLPIIKKDNVVRLANNEERKCILRDFHKRSEEIQLDGFIQDSYRIFAKSMENSIFTVFNGKESLIFRGINKLFRNILRTRRMEKHYPEDELLLLLNRINCESWRELTLEVLNNRLYGETSK